MKRSSKLTEWIVIPVFTTSECDICQLVMIHLTEEYRMQLIENVNHAMKFRGRTDFYHLSFWDEPVGWFNRTDNTTDIVSEFIEEKIPFAFVDMNGGSELDDLEVVDHRVYGEQLRIFSDGTAQFVGYDKHTGEEFATVEFPLEEILSSY